MRDNKEKAPSKYAEVKINGGTYLIERVFSGSKRVEDLITDRIVAEKQRRERLEKE